MRIVFEHPQCSSFRSYAGFMFRSQRFELGSKRDVLVSLDHAYDHRHPTKLEGRACHMCHNPTQCHSTYLDGSRYIGESESRTVVDLGRPKA